MKRTTFDCFMSLRRRVSSSSGVSTAGEGAAGDFSERERGTIDCAEPTCLSMASVRARASAPEMRESKV